MCLLEAQLGGKHVSPRENAFGDLQSCQNGRLGGAAVTAEVRTLNPLSLEPLCAAWRLQLGGKHVSPRENAFGGLQSCQNGRLGGAAVTAKVRTLNPLSLELLCAFWRLQLGGKHVSPLENDFGSVQSCQNGRLGGAAVTAEVRTVNPLSLEFLRAQGSLQLGEKHVSLRENAFGSLQSCQNGRLGGAAVTAKVRTLNPFSIGLLCAFWRRRGPEKHVSPHENAFGSLQSCQNGRLGDAAVTAEVRSLNPFSLELPCASWGLRVAEKHVSPRESGFGGFQSCQNGRLGGAAVTAEVETLNPLSLELLCA